MYRVALIRNKLIGLALTMFVAVLIASGVGAIILYKTSITETAERLTETVQSNARLIESIVRHEKSEGHTFHRETEFVESTVAQIRSAHEMFQFGHSGEFTLAKKEGDKIIFMLRNHLSGMDTPDPVPFSDSNKAEPMRRALSGESGWLIGLDYRGASVLAAYEPVETLNMGIVAKIDMSEIYAPYINAGIAIILIAILVCFVATIIFYRLGGQIARRFADSTRQFTRLAANAKDVIYRMSLPDGKYEYINPACSELFGAEPEEFYKSPKVIAEMMHPDWLPYFKEQWSDLLAGEAPASYEYQIISRSGEIKWIHQRNVLIKNKLGKPVALEGIATDITLQKEHEQRINAEKEMAQRYLDLVGSMVVALDAQGRITLLNQRGCQVLDTSLQHAIGKNWFDHFLPQENRQELKDLFIQLIAGQLEGHEFFESNIVNSLGEQRMIAWHNILLRDEDDKITGILSAGEDITERKQAEAELLLKDLVFESSLTANSIADSTGIITHMNDVFLRMWGYESREDAVGKSIRAFLSSEGEAEAIMQALTEHGEWAGEYSALKQDGSTFNAYGSATTIRDYNGDLLGYQSSVLDITASKQAKSALKSADAHAKAIINSARDAFISIDQQGIIIDWNPEAERMFGFSYDDVINRALSEIIIPQEFRDAHNAGIQHYLATGEAEVLNRHIEITAVHKNGQNLPVELSITPLQRGESLTFNAFIRDLSEINRHKEAIEASELTIRESLIGTILAISKAVEARDPYTAGHQQRVSRLARSIAQKMGLTKEQIEGIRMGAIIHDIGKIQLPAEILSKPGALTEAEFQLIKSHPESGFKILADVKFPWPVADIAYQHHERIDGSGYPRGLKGDEICLEAKVIAVADVVEAMGSHRPYRPSLGIEAALDEISKYRGSHYDEACVDACIKLFSEENFTF